MLAWVSRPPRKLPPQFVLPSSSQSFLSFQSAEAIGALTSVSPIHLLLRRVESVVRLLLGYAPLQSLRRSSLFNWAVSWSLLLVVLDWSPLLPSSVSSSLPACRIFTPLLPGQQRPWKTPSRPLLLQWRIRMHSWHQICGKKPSWAGTRWRSLVMSLPGCLIRSTRCFFFSFFLFFFSFGSLNKNLFLLFSFQFTFWVNSWLLFCYIVSCSIFLPFFFLFFSLYFMGIIR